MKNLIICLFIIPTIQFATAGIIIVEEIDQTGGAMPGKSQMTITVSGEQARIDIGKDLSSIIDSKKGTVTSLMHTQKIAMQLPEGALTAVKKQVGQQKSKLDLTATGKKEVINGFNCEEYTGTVQGLKTAFWVTSEVKNQKEILEQLGKLSGGDDPFKAVLENGEDFPGFPIRTIVNSPQVGKSTMTVMSIKNEEIPETTFEIPSDYKSMDMPKISNPESGAPALPVEPGNHSSPSHD